MAYLTIPQLAKLMGISRVTVYRKVKAGEIPAVKVGHTYVISESEITKVLSRKLSPEGKKRIEASVNKVVKEYGEVLKLLGKE